MAGIINSVSSNYTFSFSTGVVDSEEKEIMRRLLAFGIQPTGNKTIDKAKLHAVEVEKAKQEATVNLNKFLTVDGKEQERIQEKKKERKKINKIGIGAEALANYNKAFIKEKKI